MSFIYNYMFHCSVFSGVCQNDTYPAVLLYHLYRSAYYLLQPKWAGKAQHSPQHQWQPEYERQHRSYIWTKTGWNIGFTLFLTVFVIFRMCHTDCITGVITVSILMILL